MSAANASMMLTGKGFVFTAFDPAKQNETGVTLSNGNRSVARSGSGNGQVWSALGMSAGKFYCECIVADHANFMLGVANGSMVGANRYVGQDPNTWGYDVSGNKITNGSVSGYGAAWGAGDVIAIALDAAAGKLWFRKNGVWQNGGNPAAGTGAAFDTLTGGPYYIAASVEFVADANTFNFGQSDFADAPPSGFSGIGAPEE